MFERVSGVKIKFNGKSRTHQSFAKEANINNIMSRYAKTGVLVDPLLISSERKPRFGDFSDVKDYAHIVGRIQQAQADFMTLPAATRKLFDNDVEKCLAFVADPKNLKECVDLGLLPKSLLPPIKPTVPPAPAEPPTK